MPQLPAGLPTGMLGLAGASGTEAEALARMRAMLPSGAQLPAGAGIDPDQMARVMQAMGQPLAPPETLAVIDEMTEIGFLPKAMQGELKECMVLLPAAAPALGMGMAMMKPMLPQLRQARDQLHALPPAEQDEVAAALAADLQAIPSADRKPLLEFFDGGFFPKRIADAPEGVADHGPTRRLSVALPTLSAGARDRLAPFLVPPIYAESWFAQRLTGTAPAAAGTRSRIATARSTRAQASVNGQAVALPAYWKRLSTAHFNVFHLALGDPLYDDYYRAAAEAIAAVVESVYASETGLLERFPLADTAEACNGGDGAVDIYVASLGHGDVRALTTTYPERCNNVPSYIVVNSNDQALQQLRQNPTEGTRELKAILAHEIAHVLQFAMDRNGAACDEYEWLDEATAEWAMDYVDPTWNREDGAYKAASGYQRSGDFYAQYLYSDHMASIEKPGLAGNRGMNGYADYIFFQYLARKYDAQTIKAVFDASTTRASVEAVEAALAPKGGMRTVWPEFALTLWNDKLNQNLDDFARWDGYDFGLAPVVERRAAVLPVTPRRKS